jgi:hypothetical protein
MASTTINVCVCQKKVDVCLITLWSCFNFKTFYIFHLSTNMQLKKRGQEKETLFIQIRNAKHESINKTNNNFKGYKHKIKNQTILVQGCMNLGNK